MAIPSDFDLWRAALTTDDWGPGLHQTLSDGPPTNGDDEFEGTSDDESVNLRGGNDIWDEPNFDSGNDRISGGKGRDTIDLGDGDDVGKGGAGADKIDGGSGNDRLFGGAGKDELSAFSGNNIMFGGRGDDEVRGGRDNDKLDGGGGDDRVSGGNGRDRLTGGNGDDIIFAGFDDGARDRIFFDENDGSDDLFSFELGIDQIVITGDVVNSLDQVEIGESIIGNALLLIGRTEVNLVGITVDDLPQVDIVFV